MLDTSVLYVNSYVYVYVTVTAVGSCCFLLFTALCLCRAVLAMSEMSVCLSVCLFVKRVNCDKTKETSANIILQCSFPTRSMVGE